MVILTVVFVLYFFLLVILLVGWNQKADPTPRPGGGKEPLISVIVPVRNEENTISKLLRTLREQVYRNFEIIVVNDDSEDETLWMVSQSEMPNVRIIHSPGKGKKAAIAAGVRAARGSIIVTTDADCVVLPSWLHEIRDRFRDPRIMMVFGGVRMVGDDSLLSTLQAMEFASLIGAGGATALLGYPVMCNGANLAYRKKVFSEVKGYDDNINIPSGDDEFLMRKVDHRHPGGISFLRSQDALVTTGTQRDLRSFVNQRIRWASKWRYNTSFSARILAVAVLLFQVVFIVNWFLLFTPAILLSIFLLSLKMILEAAFLLQVCRFLRIRWKWAAFFVLQATYPLYVIGVGVASFFRPFEWKHRIFKPQ